MTIFLKNPQTGKLKSYNTRMLNKTTVTAPTDHMPHVQEIVTDDSGLPLLDASGNVLRKWRPYVYNDATVWSMISPQAYTGARAPYGFCASYGGSVYQVNNYSGTANIPTHADWDNLGAGAYFVPVATHEDLNAVRAAATRTWGTGTPFAASYVGQGLAGRYIQVADIDLSSYANWARIGTSIFPVAPFAGVYDGGAYRTYNILNATFQNDNGLFGGNTGKIRNLHANGNITDSRQNTSILLSSNNAGGIVQNCIISGTIRSTHTAPVAGGIGANAGNVVNVVSFVANRTGDHAGTGSLIGSVSAGLVINCYACGKVTSTNFSTGGLIGANSGTVTASYANTQTTETAKYIGNPALTVGNKTTQELLSLYDTTWDSRIWQFINNRYPIHRFFGELPLNLPPPISLNSSIVGSDIVLTWADYVGTPSPSGYYVYVSKANGAWTKINATAITAKTLAYAHTGAASYNFFVTGVYNRRYVGETGNSVTKIQVVT